MYSTLKEDKPRTRSYSITSESDYEHTSNGRCPNYALAWSIKDNSYHWPERHDYFIGNGSNLNDETRELRQILSQRLANGILTKYIIFCDLDGVLADFEQGIKNKFGLLPSQVKPNVMWSYINKSNTFFENLPWMPKGKLLWEKIQIHNPIILTGVPRGSKNMAEQKIRWCQRELGPDVQVITCLSKDKHRFCIPRSILIDDRTDNLEEWNKKGGKFLLYNEENLDDIIDRVERHMGTVLPSP
jgi:5'(3')-deoxyribonucleotidase